MGLAGEGRVYREQNTQNTKALWELQSPTEESGELRCCARSVKTS